MSTEQDVLTQKSCKPCEGGVDPLTPEQVQTFLEQTPEWFADEGCTTIAHTFVFEHFQAAVDFISTVAGIAESEGHHPDLFLHKYKHVTVSLTTHAINGLSENDFIVAAKIDATSQ